MKNKQNWLIVSIIVFLLLFSGCSRVADDVADDKVGSISLATSSVGSTPYVISVGIADIITKEGKVSMQVQSFGGSDASTRAVRDGKMDTATVNTLALNNAYWGKEQFAAEGKASSLRLLMLGNSTPRYIVAKEGSGIKDFQDLRGKTIIGRRTALADMEQALDAYLQIAGVDKTEVKIVESAAETREEINTLRVGAVDAIVGVTNPVQADFQEAAREVPLVILSLTEEQINGPVVKNYLSRGFALMSVANPDVPYKITHEKGIVLAAPFALVASDKLPDDIAYNIIMDLHDNYDTLCSVHSLAKEWTIENTLRNPPIPFHDGAIKAFKELGKWTDELENIQSRLLNYQE